MNLPAHVRETAPEVDLGRNGGWGGGLPGPPPAEAPARRRAIFNTMTHIVNCSVIFT